MTDQKTSSPDQKDPSTLGPERRRRMREAAEAAAREAPGEWRTGERGAAGYWLGFHAVTCDAAGEAAEAIPRAVLLQPNSYFPVEPISLHVVETQPAAIIALLDWLEEQEEAAAWCAAQLRRTAEERDALREKLAAAERRFEAMGHAAEARAAHRELAEDDEVQQPDIEFEDRGSGETRRIVAREVYRR